MQQQGSDIICLQGDEQMAIVNAIKKVRKHLEIMIDGERICDL